jgi:glutamate N-acetyltransferase/amino-acid N-acetyltransferase
MTTDTCAKTVCEELEIEGSRVRISGLAKGAGMIEPNMATMLAFVMTDAAVARPALQAALKRAVDRSFNRITVDGDMSTNDTVLCLANGAAGNRELSYEHAHWEDFCAALERVCFELAMMIVGDGEGAKKIVTVTVEGAATDVEAEKAARAIANSLLVKTSWVKNDVNWGRVMDALGYSGANLQERSIDIFYDDQAAVLGGMVADTPLEALQAAVAASRFSLRIHLHIGIGEATVYSCECTEEYVRINY